METAFIVKELHHIDTTLIAIFIVLVGLSFIVAFRK